MTDYGPALAPDTTGSGTATRVRLRLVPRASASALAGVLGVRARDLEIVAGRGRARRSFAWPVSGSRRSRAA